MGIFPFSVSTVELPEKQEADSKIQKSLCGVILWERNYDGHQDYLGNQGYRAYLLLTGANCYM